MANNLDIVISTKKWPSIQKYFHHTSTHGSIWRKSSRKRRRRTARVVAPRPFAHGGKQTALGAWTWLHALARIGYVEMARFDENYTVRRAHGPAALSRTLHCLSLRLDNRPTVEKSSCPIRNHQFSLGVRPYAPWYRQKPQDRLDRFYDYRLLPIRMLIDSTTIDTWLSIKFFSLQLYAFIKRVFEFEDFVSLDLARQHRPDARKIFSIGKFCNIGTGYCNSFWMRWIRVNSLREKKKNRRQ